MDSETDWSFHFMTKTDKSCFRAKQKQWQVEYVLYSFRTERENKTKFKDGEDIYKEIIPLNASKHK